MKYRKGQGGRPKGARNHRTIEVETFTRGLLEDPVYRAGIRRDLLKRRLAPAFEMLLWYYAYGKPKERLEHQGEVGLTTVVQHIFESTAGVPSSAPPVDS